MVVLNSLTELHFVGAPGHPTADNCQRSLPAFGVAVPPYGRPPRQSINHSAGQILPKASAAEQTAHNHSAILLAVCSSPQCWNMRPDMLCCGRCRMLDERGWHRVTRSEPRWRGYRLGSSPLRPLHITINSVLTTFLQDKERCIVHRTLCDTSSAAGSSTMWKEPLPGEGLKTMRRIAELGIRRSLSIMEVPEEELHTMVNVVACEFGGIFQRWYPAVIRDRMEGVLGHAAAALIDARYNSEEGFLGYTSSTYMHLIKEGRGAARFPLNQYLLE
jgi:hypothetical protein